MEDRTRFIVF